MNATIESRRVSRLRKGDEREFEALVAELHQSLLVVARAYVRTRAAAEDAVQDTWAAVIEGLARFEGRSTLKTWIFRILANRARTRAVREGRQIPFSAVAAADEPAVEPDRFRGGRWVRPPAAPPDPLQRAIDREALAAHRRALRRLPPAQRAVVVLRDVQGLGAEDACRILSVGAGNQRVLLHRGRAKLRLALEAYLEGR